MSKRGRRGGGRRHPSPNDQRSNVKNPNNPAFKAARDNRDNQLNPEHPTYRASRRGSSTPRINGGEFWDYGSGGESTVFLPEAFERIELTFDEHGWPQIECPCHLGKPVIIKTEAAIHRHFQVEHRREYGHTPLQIMEGLRKWRSGK